MYAVNYKTVYSGDAPPEVIEVESYDAAYELFEHMVFNQRCAIQSVSITDLKDNSLLKIYFQMQPSYGRS